MCRRVMATAMTARREMATGLVMISDLTATSHQSQAHPPFAA